MGKGVKLYAFDLLDVYKEAVEYAAGDGQPILKLTKKTLLNGASDWREYSYDGSALIFDYDISERLCTPSEWKQCKYGELRPNRGETWLDIQARALLQASCLIQRIASKVRHQAKRR